eukprot:4978592-Pleurochrysis_carterae.AAC.1
MNVTEHGERRDMHRVIAETTGRDHTPAGWQAWRRNSDHRHCTLTTCLSWTVRRMEEEAFERNRTEYGDRLETHRGIPTHLHGRPAAVKFTKVETGLSSHLRLRLSSLSPSLPRSPFTLTLSTSRPLPAPRFSPSHPPRLAHPSFLHTLPPSHSPRASLLTPLALPPTL